MRVLLLQPEHQTIRKLERFFKDRGDEVFTAWDLNQGVHALVQTRPHLLLLDMHFPGTAWLNFLRNTRQGYPDLRIILTNKFPDLQREMLAKELGVTTFLRQPFTQRWMENALRRVFDTAAVDTKTAPRSLILPQVKLPVRIKITLPYLLLAVLFALASAFVISQVVLDSIRNRFLDQLVQTGRQATDWMVGEEDRLLATLRLINNSSGMGDLVNLADAEGLRERILPLAVNAGEEAVVVLNMQGISLLTMFQVKDEPGNYQYARGEATFAGLEFVQKILANQVDRAGDKYAGMVNYNGRDYFFVGGPVFDGTGSQAGVVLVGKTLPTLADEMAEATQAQVTLYAPLGNLLTTTLFTEAENFPLDADQATAAMQEPQTNSRLRDVQVSGIDFMEILGPWEARHGADLGVLGVALQQTFLVNTSRETQALIFVLVAAVVLGVILLGLYLAARITRPLLRLVRASTEVAQGNFEVKVDSQGDDEIAVLAQSFNYMIAGLQEGSIYRDLLGRTVSPEVREQLRHTFTSGNVRLDGQEAVASVIITDIRGFTTLSERTDPSTVLGWLNEYFGKLVPIINQYGGVVNKFDGDAMLAFFGILPRRLSPKAGARNACMAALNMMLAINQLNLQRHERGEPALITGMGINTGVVIAGGLGSSDRLHYTVIGDTVNTTQRLETLTRTVSNETCVVISDSTYTALAEYRADFLIEPIGAYELKGKSEQVMAYHLLSLAAAPKEPVGDSQ